MTELEHELYAKGVDARVLLDSGIVQTAFVEIATALKDAMANTPPADKEKREAFYYTHRGLLELHNLLSSYAIAKEQIDALDEVEQEDLFEQIEDNSNF